MERFRLFDFYGFIPLSSPPDATLSFDWFSLLPLLLSLRSILELFFLNEDSLGLAFDVAFSGII
jgi:hypothetical protein